MKTPSRHPQPSHSEPQPGTVWLIGAGPGDPELLTLKALRIISQADIVLYDSLISDDILTMLPKRCVRLHTGKRCGAHSMGQPDINKALHTAAQKYRCVVRLKGGDPFLFGRGGEELEYLQQRHIPVQIIPGITAALGCAAAAHIPLTHRQYGNALMLHSGHSQYGDFAASHSPTRVFYMGLRQAGQITGHLLNEGIAEDTPVALIVNGTLPDQRVLKGVLMDLPHLAQRCLHDSKGPGLIIVGEVAAMARVNAGMNGDIDSLEGLIANAASSAVA
ncbi:uroporphyrinogen-III C-methyltransferase [Oceanospirillaceae bacterium ASx5O]|nr:uroporphyrinogen-III C-methyltransferase [Oceanospirillaceae bacterium ASx5O]